MFSQYSWWDFIKVVLALAVPYYAYVLWTYYREDFREWISNRDNGQDAGIATPAADDEDEEESPLYVANGQRDSRIPIDSKPQQSAQQPPAAWLSEPAKPTEPVSITSVTPLQEPEPAVVQLDGPAVSEETETVGFALLMQTENVEEQSIDELNAIAERLNRTEAGLVEPKAIADRPAARLADIINQQRTNPLNDVAFNR